MPRFRIAALFLVAACCAAAAASAATVAMYGDFRVQGTFFSNQNYTGWNATGTQTEDTLNIWQRLRLHVDFASGEHLAFRLGLRVNNETWGHGTLTAANPSPAVEPYQCYLQFTVPETRVTVTAGYQPLSLPHTAVFYDSVVLGADSGNSDAAALVVSAPLIDERLSVTAGYARLVDTNRTYDTTTTQVGDELDFAFLTLPVTLSGAQVTPWGAVAILGRSASLPGSMGNSLLSASSFAAPSAFANNQNAALWTGFALTAELPFPVKVYADGVYGDAFAADRHRNRRHGWFADAALEYTGFAAFAPQLLGWWGSGEDAALADGSERLPAVNTEWGPRGSFLFNADQDLTQASMNTTPQGSKGLVLNFDRISLVPRLTSLVAFSYAAGTNSPAGLRKAVALTGGPGHYATMGQDLAEGERLCSVAWEHAYALTDAVNLIAETGFAHGEGFRASIWGRRMVHQAGDAWQAALGLIYRF
ncbi:MAG: outer membrane homotrimeric porin [Solidesulfovibrio sp.]|uniref:outer membrane homotrimeric porin n=1 Tax=Solidesulfovibrio sp. TaxID=2910990 RepID=UPI002B1EF30B|nr:outer membrane homotrimeric porin [Solidesulfovibrio sp.]MEA4858760.1 outer membrane homotrimeric porin [Solidesulfovibrio sp.]